MILQEFTPCLLQFLFILPSLECPHHRASCTSPQCVCQCPDRISWSFHLRATSLCSMALHARGLYHLWTTPICCYCRVGPTTHFPSSKSSQLCLYDCWILQPSLQPWTWLQLRFEYVLLTRQLPSPNQSFYQISPYSIMYYHSVSSINSDTFNYLLDIRLGFLIRICNLDTFNLHDSTLKW